MYAYLIVYFKTLSPNQCSVSVAFLQMISTDWTDCQRKKVGFYSFHRCALYLVTYPGEGGRFQKVTVCSRLSEN